MKIMKSIMAEFAVREFRLGDKSRTELIIHGNNKVAQSKWHNVYENKLYEQIFDIVKKELTSK